MKASNSYHCTNVPFKEAAKEEKALYTQVLFVIYLLLSSEEGMQPLEGRSRSWSGGGKGRVVLSVKVNASIPRTTKLMVPSWA